MYQQPSSPPSQPASAQNLLTHRPPGDQYTAWGIFWVVLLVAYAAMFLFWHPNHIASDSEQPQDVSAILSEADEYYRSQNYADASATYLRALHLMRDQNVTDSELPAKDKYQCAVSQYNMNQKDDAIQVFKQIADYGPGGSIPNELVASSFEFLGNYYDLKQQYAEAKQQFEEALLIYGKISSAPGMKSARANLAVVCSQQADEFYAKQDYRSAVACYRESLDYLGYVENAGSAMWKRNVRQEISCYFQLQDDESAKAVLNEIEQASGFGANADPRFNWFVYNALGCVNQQLSGKDQAEHFYQKALSSAKLIEPAANDEIATTLTNLAILYQSQGLWDKAMPVLQEAWKTYEGTDLAQLELSNKADDNNLTEAMLTALADNYRHSGQTSARKLALKRLAELKQTIKSAASKISASTGLVGSPSVSSAEVKRLLKSAAALSRKAAEKLMKQKYDEAAGLYNQSISLRQKAHSQDQALFEDWCSLASSLSVDRKNFQGEVTAVNQALPLYYQLKKPGNARKILPVMDDVQSYYGSTGQEDKKRVILNEMNKIKT